MVDNFILATTSILLLWLLRQENVVRQRYQSVYCLGEVLDVRQRAAQMTDIQLTNNTQEPFAV